MNLFPTSTNMQKMDNLSSRLYLLPLFLLFLHIIVVCLASTLTSRKDITTDKEALLSLKNNIDDPLVNWSSAAYVCDWVGVTCSTRHRRVAELDISLMGLTGRIPPQIGNLSFLVSLNMSFNYFHGDLPQEMSHLRRLRSLDLGYNNIKGSIPSWFGNLQSLKMWVMYGNQLEGPLADSFFYMPSLQYLILGNNSISGTLPSNICDSLPKLTKLNIYDNNMEGQIPTTIGRCSFLQHLTLSSNGFSGSIPREIGNLTKLKALFCANNFLTGTIPEEILNLTSLTGFYFGDNMLSGTIPEEIGKLTRLREFYGPNNSLTGSIPSSMFNISSLELVSLAFNQLSGTLPTMRLPNLVTLELDMNHLEGPIPTSIANSSRIEQISLAVNNFRGPIPSASLGSLRSLQHLSLIMNNFTSESYSSSSELGFIDALTNCRNLTDLWLSYNPLDGILPASIGNFSSKLEAILMSQTKIKGRIPEEIGNLKSLTNLHLRGNELTGRVPQTFRGLQHLQALDISNNKYNGSFPNVLCKLPNLFLVSLSNNQFSGSLPECFGDITSLRELFFNENNFSSRIPESFSNLKSLLRLNLSTNSLNGSLDPDMGRLGALIDLDLSVNQFSGKIPETFSKMTSLESLNLSVNNLSGAIPKTLESLFSLKYFNVSFNQLDGEIPRKGPFQNFTRQSFMANNLLCGAPELDFPPCPSYSIHKPANRKKLTVIIVSSSLAFITVLLCIFIFIMLKKFRNRKARTQPESSLNKELERISYFELQQATDGFSETNLLGAGSFGSVYKTTLISEQVYAVKVFNLQNEGACKSFDQECEALRNIRHRNLVRVVTCCTNPDFKSLVLQYMANGSLQKWLYDEHYHLDLLQRLDVMIDVACALEYLHHGNPMFIVHCDLKPSNVLLDEGMVAHVSDFGISKLLGEEEDYAHTKTLATFGYMAPEYGTEGLVTTSCDVYSFGIMLMEVFTGRSPSDEMFNGDLDLRSWVANGVKDSLLSIIDEGILNVDEEHFHTKLQLASSIIDLGLTCSTPSPKSRIDMKEVEVSLRRIKVSFLQCS